MTWQLDRVMREQESPPIIEGWEVVDKLLSLFTLVGGNSVGCPHSPSEPHLPTGAADLSIHSLLALLPQLSFLHQLPKITSQRNSLRY